MSGMAEILDENTRLREKVELQAMQNDALTARIEALESSNELLVKHFEFLEKKRQLAATERFIADQNQEQLYADSEVAVPPRDPKVEAEDQDRPGAILRRRHGSRTRAMASGARRRMELPPRERGGSE